MNNYNDLNNFLSTLKINNKKKKFLKDRLQTQSSNEINLIDSYKNSAEFNTNFDKNKKEKALQERQEFNKRLFERSLENIIPPKFTETNIKEKKSKDNNEYINKKLFDRHLLLSNSNTNKVFDQIPELTRNINKKNKHQ